MQIKDFSKLHGTCFFLQTISLVPGFIKYAPQHQVLRNTPQVPIDFTEMLDIVETFLSLS